MSAFLYISSLVGLGWLRLVGFGCVGSGCVLVRLRLSLLYVSCLSCFLGCLGADVLSVCRFFPFSVFCLSVVSGKAGNFEDPTSDSRLLSSLDNRSKQRWSLLREAVRGFPSLWKPGQNSDDTWHMLFTPLPVCIYSRYSAASRRCWNP